MNLRSLLSESSYPLILGHQNADPDAVCAMLAFARMYRIINPKGTPVLIADDLSRLSNQVMNTFVSGESILETEGIESDLVILLDTNSVFQLGPKFQKIPQNPSKTIVIDHHEINPETEAIAEHRLVKTDRSSTCEIMVNLFEEYNIPIDSMTANLLLTGIIFDTRRFYFADVLTLQTAIKLIEYGANYEQCIKALLMRPDRSERIARLKAAGRVKIHQIGDWLVVTSKIGAFEASVCRSLLDMGADVAIVGGAPSNDVVRISSRSTREFSISTTINLGKDVMEPLGSIIDGRGGGHANAAGANGTKGLDEAIVKSVELIRTIVEKEHTSSRES
ncbi:MAG: DHH family phosphoesterase [Candidatus Thorarchaeota archaeon]|nr:DHH family phosphoesterase [Candidatus Thorarchaeota archaeon]